MVKFAEASMKTKALRILSTKCALAARVDACKTCPSGEEGRKLKLSIESRFEKVQAP
jgi:RNA processing factor Prp31